MRAWRLKHLLIRAKETSVIFFINSCIDIPISSCTICVFKIITTIILRVGLVRLSNIVESFEKLLLCCNSRIIII